MEIFGIVGKWGALFRDTVVPSVKVCANTGQVKTDGIISFHQQQQQQKKTDYFMNEIALNIVRHIRNTYISLVIIIHCYRFPHRNVL